jgi:ubiquinone biosynthesis protein
VKNIHRLLRFWQILSVLVKYGLDALLLDGSRYAFLSRVFYVFPSRWHNAELRQSPRGQRIRMALEELGPIFVKFGQILSTRRDLLPDDIGDELARLQDRVAAFSADVARAEIQQTLKSSPESIFAYFDAEAMASASIAQVHAARLHSGEEVVVKVLRPGIRQRIERDVQLLFTFAHAIQRLAGVDGGRLKPVEVVSEFEKTIYDELDLQREAANATELRRNSEDLDIIYVPRVFWDYTRTNVMVIERIHGISVRETSQLRDLGVNMEILAERGVEIFFTQVFRDNFFHADMHPGNIFVDASNVNDPTYIAVDFGIVGSLTDFDRNYLAENFLAFFNRDYRRVAQLHIDSGWVPADTRVEYFESSIRTVCEPIFEKPLDEISFGQVLLRLFQTARRFNMEVQPQLVLLQKTLLNIEGMGREIYPQLDLWRTAKPHLETWVREQRGPRAMVKHVLEQAPLWLQHSPEIPMMVYNLLEQNAPTHKTPAMTESSRAEASSRSLLLAISGGFLFLTGGLSVSMLFADHAGVPLAIATAVALGGVVLMFRAVRSAA